MRLERDEFVINYRVEQISIDGLIEIVRKAGYSAKAVEDSAKPESADTTGTKPTSDDPVFLAALKEARETNRPLVIDFYASWCGPCRKMLEKTMPDPSVAPLLEQTVFLKVDTDVHPDLATAFSVSGLPDIRILDPDGRQLRKLTGFQDAPSFRAVLTEILAGAHDRSFREQ